MNMAAHRRHIITWALSLLALGALFAGFAAGTTANANSRPSSARWPLRPRLGQYATIAQPHWQQALQQQYDSPQALTQARAKLARVPQWRFGPRTSTSASRAAPSPHSLPTNSASWTPLGPANVEGYFNDVTSYEVTSLAIGTNASTVYAGTPNGGVWKTTDGGTSWAPLTDAQQTPSIGDIAVDPANRSVIYAATGANTGSSHYSGLGILKSTNGGTTWSLIANAQLVGTNIYRVAVDPGDSNVLLAADDDPSGGPTISGVWRSSDGGSTWTQVLSDASNTQYNAAAATDVIFDPANGNVVYAALGNIIPFATPTGAAGVYESTDAGKTWTQLTSGIPTGQNVGRVSLGISQNGQHLYAAIGDSGYTSGIIGQLLNSSIYTSTNSGSSWTANNVASTPIGTNGNLGFGWNDFGATSVDPTDSTGNTAEVGDADLFKTADGGVTWTDLSSAANATAFPGYGYHRIAYVSSTSSTSFVGSLYGVWSVSGTGSFTDANGSPGSGISADVIRALAYGDQGSSSPLYAQSDPYSGIQYPASGGAPAAWNSIFSRLFTLPVPDWANNSIVYQDDLACSTSSCTFAIDKSTSGGLGFSPTSFSTTDAIGTGPLVVSPAVHTTVYLGTTRVWRSTDSGATWAPFSPQLDTNPTLYGNCTGPSDSNCPTISEIVGSPTSSGTLYVLYNDSSLYATFNGGASWVTENSCSLAGSCPVLLSHVAVSPASPYDIYAVGYHVPLSSSIFKSSNGGQTWTALDRSYPGSFAADVAVSPLNPHLVVVSAYLGVFATSDDGATWQNLTGNLPNSFMFTVAFSHDGTQLIVGTEGRGVWAIALGNLTQPAPVTLTTTLGVSPTNQTLALNNTGQGALSWNAGSLPSWVGVSPTSGTLAPGASQNLTLTFNTTSPTQQTYATVLDLTTSGADDPTVSVPITVSSNLSTTWYFAEGFTGGSFTEYLTLANPNPVTANVSVEYLLQNGSAPITKSYTVSPTSRKTLNVNTELGLKTGVSLVVTSDQPIVAERPMYFTFTGQGLHVPGGTDVLGATQLGTQFDFGYLDTTANHATYLTVLNPNASAMTVTVNYYAAAGGSPTVVTHSVPANARGTITVNSDMPAGSYSALVTLSASGLVERPMYLVDATTGYTGSADVIGVQSSSTNWSFAEGFTSSNFDERYILSNPSASATAHATVTFLKSNGTTVTANATLSPGQQQVVSANSVLGLKVNNSATVTSDQPILAERFMSFTYMGAVGVSSKSSIPGATDVLGAQQASDVFMFAEGFTGGQFAEYLTLQNPNASTTQVTVVYLPQNGGAPTIATYSVGATSRYTILTNQVMPAQSFSMVVIASQPIVAERPMYFDYAGSQTGGTDIIGYQP